jgi:hypothetical protein
VAGLIAIGAERTSVRAADPTAPVPRDAISNEPTADDSADAAKSQRADEAAQLPTSERKPNVVFAYLALIGILIAGLALVAATMMWGHRVRRLARTPFPSGAPRDELWYLRPKKDLHPDDESGSDDAPDDSARDEHRS